MPNLADNLQAEQFIRKLTHCEKNISQMSDWERKFVRDLREKFESREDMEDMGLTPWNPSANQVNTLATLREAYP